MAKDRKDIEGQVVITQAAAGTFRIAEVVDEQSLCKLVSIFVTVRADDTTLQFKSGATAMTGAPVFLKGGGIGAKGSVEEPLLKTLEAGADLNLTSVGGGFDGWATFYIEGDG